MTRDANVAARVPGRASALSRAALLLGTALAGGFYFTPTGALAACTNSGGLDVVATCTLVDNNGHTVIGRNVTVTFDPSSLPPGSILNNDTALNAYGSRGLTVNMLNSNSEVVGLGAGDEDGIKAGFLGGSSSSHTLTINGDVRGSDEGMQLGFLNGNAALVIGGESIIRGDNGNGLQVGILNAGRTLTINSAGEIRGGLWGVNTTAEASFTLPIIGTQSISGPNIAAVDITNTGMIKSTGTGAGGGLYATSLSTITYAGANGQIWTNPVGGGPGMMMLAAGEIEVKSFGTLTSGETGASTAITLGSTSIALPFVPATISGGSIALSLTGVTIGDAVNGTPGDKLTTTGDYGIFAGVLVGDIGINVEGSKISAVNGTGVFGIAGGHVSITTGEVTSGTNGFNFTLPIVGAVSLSGGAVGVALAGDANVTNKGKVTADGSTFGIAAISLGGNATATVNAEIDPPIIGAASATIGAGTATTNVNALVQATSVGALAANIGSGSVVINTTALGEIQTDGIGLLAVNIGSGNTTVDARASIGGLNNNQATDGIVVFNTGDGAVKVTTYAGADIQASNNGIGVFKVGDGNVDVVAGDKITAGEDGILIDRGLGTGDIKVSSTGRIRINAGDDGVQVNSGGGNGLVSVDLRGRITAGDDGISVLRLLDEGNVDVNFRGRLEATGGDGVQVVLGGGNGDASVNVRGRVNAGDDGIFVERILGDGKINVGFRGRMAAVDDGIEVVRKGGVGDIAVDVASRTRITAATGDGIRILGLDTRGDVTVDVERARITAASGSAIDVATFSLNGDNNVTVYNDGRLAGAGTVLSPTVRAITDGNVFIDNDGSIRNADNSLSGIAVAALGGGSVRLVNTEYVRGSMFLGSLDLSAPTPELAATTTFDNSGTWETSGLSGFGAVNSVFVNNNGLIRTSGNTFFGFLSASSSSNYYNNFDTTEVNGALTIGMIAPDDANYVYNSGSFLVNGTLNALGGSGLQFENDGGIVDMRFGSGVNDRVNISGDYIGGLGLGANSRLGVDTFLGGPGSPSDLMTVGLGINSGSTSGVTSVIVRDANFNGPGAYNPTGIDFVRVTSGNTQLGQFVLSPDSDHYDPSRGVLDKGLFFYDIATRGNGDGSRSQVLIGAPDSEVFELSRATTAAQNIWHESAGVWLDRQADLRHQLMKQMVVAAPTVVSKGYDAPAPVFTTMGGAITPGAWLKAIGSWTNRDGAQKYSILDRSYSFNLDYKQDTYGVIGGLDFGMRGMHNQNDALVFGVLAGYLKSDVDFSASRNGYSYEGATVGLYATYLNNGFFADLLGKADLLKMSWSSPSLSGFVDSRGDRDANSYGFRLDSGYRYAFSPSMFIEPSATIAYVRTTIDSFDVPGGQINWQDGQSFRGALGLRVGGAFAATPAMTVEASLTGRLWNEFEGNNKVSVINAGPTFLATDNFEGAFGEVSGSLNIFGNNTGWSGFINAGVKFNNELTTTTAKAGIRYVFGKAPAPAPVAAAPVLAVRY